MTPLQQRIKDRLAEINLSAHAAALKVGDNPDLIRQVLRASGTSHPREDTIRKIAVALDVSETWLLTGQDQSVKVVSKLFPEKHKAATKLAIQSLEAGGLEINADNLSELIVLLYEKMTKAE